MDSTRLKVKKALTALLENINPANGYAFDLTGKVWRGRNRIGDEEKPCLIIVDVIPEETNYAGESKFRTTWELGIKGFAGVDRIHPTDDAENLMASIKKALYPMVDSGGEYSASNDYLLGGLVNSAEVDTGVVFPPDEGLDAAYCVVKVSFGLVENLENPYE